MINNSSALFIRCWNKSAEVVAPRVHGSDIGNAVFSHDRRLSRLKMVGLAVLERAAACSPDKDFLFAVVRLPMFLGFLSD